MEDTANVHRCDLMVDYSFLR